MAAPRYQYHQQQSVAYPSASYARNPLAPGSGPATSVAFRPGGTIPAQQPYRSAGPFPSAVGSVRPATSSAVLANRQQYPHQQTTVYTSAASHHRPATFGYQPATATTVGAATRGGHPTIQSRSATASGGGIPPYLPQDSVADAFATYNASSTRAHATGGASKSKNVRSSAKHRSGGATTSGAKKKNRGVGGGQHVSPSRVKSRTGKKDEGARWAENVYCTDGGSWWPWGKKQVRDMRVAERDANKHNQHFDQIRLFDGTDFTLEEVEDDDWDLFQDPFAGHTAARRGPERRNSTELNISIRDLFPCFGDVMDACGCAPKRKTREHILPRSAPDAVTPQMETVCLECGHCLDHKHLGKSVMRDACAHTQVGRAFDDVHQAPKKRLGDDALLKSGFPFGYGETVHDWEDRKTAYSGYEGWEIEERKTDRAGDEKVPLPNFSNDEPRLLRAKPGRTGKNATARWMESDHFDLDETGRVALPGFGDQLRDSQHRDSALGTQL